MNNYQKNYGLWLGGALALNFLVSYLTYYPYIYWIFVILGIIIATVQTHKAEQQRIKFRKAFLAGAIVIVAYFLIGLVKILIQSGFGSFSFILFYFSPEMIMSIYLLVIILLLTGAWYMFEKAGKPGWASIVPFYNIIVMLQIAQKPMWWIAMFIIPFANFVFMIMMFDAIAKKFGKDTGFTVGLVFLNQIFIAVLGYGDAVFEGYNTISAEETDLLDN